MDSPLLMAADYVQRRAAISGAALAVGSPPTTEKGTSLPSAASGSPVAGSLGAGAPSWDYFYRSDELEHVPDLKWKPNGKGLVQVYHQMRADAQVQGLFLASTLPVRRYAFHLNPNGASDTVLKALSGDYNIPIHGQEDQPRGRRQKKFSFQDFLRHTLLAMLYGHMFFEQVGTIGADGLWHLRKLGVRMPHSISKISLDKDGGLKSIEQRGMGMTSGGRQRNIPVERLLAYVWEQEGANWTGRSLCRGIYKNYLLKDTVLRVGAINIERAGGVPVITGPKGATPEDLQELGKMAMAFRVGANAGGAIPHGATLDLARAAGGEEAVAYVKLMNEEMSRGWLLMFLNLGQATTGSYALGSSLIDYALNAQEVVANWICDVFSEHMIEDHVNWNWGEDEQHPLLSYTRTDDRQMGMQDLAQLIDKNVITVDDELESWIREEFRMPPRDPDATARTPSSVGSPPAGASGQPSDAFAETIAELTAARIDLMNHADD